MFIYLSRWAIAYLYLPLPHCTLLSFTFPNKTNLVSVYFPLTFFNICYFKQNKTPFLSVYTISQLTLISVVRSSASLTSFDFPSRLFSQSGAITHTQALPARFRNTVPKGRMILARFYPNESDILLNCAERDIDSPN